MGQANSKKNNPTKGLKIIPDSPLGQMLTQGDENELTKDLDRVQMIQYCVLEWPRKKIQKDGLKWPKYGSSELWLCQALYIYIHYKGAKKSEQLPYAKVWLKYWNKEANEKIFALKRKQNESKESKLEDFQIDNKQKESDKKLNQSRWDPLDALPPASSPQIGREGKTGGQPTCTDADHYSSPCSVKNKNLADLVELDHSQCTSPS